MFYIRVAVYMNKKLNMIIEALGCVVCELVEVVSNL